MTPDPRPQWEDCKVCGGDHWTKDHPSSAPDVEGLRRAVLDEVLALPRTPDSTEDSAEDDGELWISANDVLALRDSRS